MFDKYTFSVHSCYNYLANYNIGFYICTVLYFTYLKQNISQTVRLLPNPLPDVTVEITPICGKYVTISSNVLYVYQIVMINV